MADEIEIVFNANTMPVEQAVARVKKSLSKLDDASKKHQDIFKTAQTKNIASLKKFNTQLTLMEQKWKAQARAEQDARKASAKLSKAQAKHMGSVANSIVDAYKVGINATIEFGTALVDSIRSAREFIEELEGIENPLFEFGSQADEILGRVNDKFDTVLGTTKLLKVQFALEFAESVGTITTAFEHMLLAAAKVNAKLMEMSGGALGLGRVIVDLATGGGYSQLEVAAEMTNKVFARQHDELVRLESDFSKVSESALKKAEEEEKAAKAAAKALEKKERENAKAAKAAAKASAEFAKGFEKTEETIADLQAKGLEGIEAVNYQWQKQANLAFAVLKLNKENAKTDQERVLYAAQMTALSAALMGEKNRMTKDFRDKEAEDQTKAWESERAENKKHLQDMLDQEAEMYGGHKKKQGQRTDAEKAELMESATAYAGFAQDLLGTTSNIFSNIMENAQGATKKQRKTYFAISKAAAMAEAAIAVTLGTIQALATPPPPNFVAAGLMAGLGAIEIATLAAQKPPSFHVGSRASDLAADEMRITRREGLAVLTPQGMASGGGEAVTNANAGRDVSAPSTVLFQYEHRLFDATVTDAANRVNSPLGRMLKNKRLGHRSRNG